MAKIESISIGEFLNNKSSEMIIATADGNGNFLLDKYNDFADWAIGKQAELFFEPARQVLHDLLLDMWNWFILSLPDIMGYTTILAAIIIILGSMIGKGGMIKPLAVWSGLMIVALCILGGV